MIVSCFIAVMEFMWENRKLSKDPEVIIITKCNCTCNCVIVIQASIWTECWKEFKFAVDLRAGDTKPVEKEDDESGSGSGKSGGGDSGDSSSTTSGDDHYGVINEDLHSKATSAGEKSTKKAKSESAYETFNDKKHHSKH